MLSIFHQVSQRCSRITTESYSTSFASAIRLLHQDLREPIYNIYGLVRFADEIVDTFHGFEQASLLQEFEQDTYRAISAGISLNPILHSFQLTVHKYDIPADLIDAFFKSMRMDLGHLQYDRNTYDEYIYGSAEVVGLMCLLVFCEGDRSKYEMLTPYARSLGAAFQKVNFLRDLRTDFRELNRVYFPGVDFRNFTQHMKANIEAEIAADFHHAYQGIVQLPWKARFAVYVAYKYYYSLFNKIKTLHPARILAERIRIPNYRKTLILCRASLKNQLNLL